MSRSTSSNVFSTSSMMRRNRRDSLNMRRSRASPSSPRTSSRLAIAVPTPYQPVMTWRFCAQANTQGMARRSPNDFGPKRGGGAPHLSRRQPAPRRGADIEHRDLLERARRLEIGDEVGMTHEPRIGSAGGAREGFERVLELALWTKLLLALGLQRVLEHRGGKQLHLIERRTLIGIFVGHPCALLGDAETPTDRAGGLGGDGTSRRPPAARHRAAAAVEKRNGDA